MTCMLTGATFAGTRATSVMTVATLIRTFGRDAPTFVTFVKIRRKVIRRRNCVRIGEKSPETLVISVATDAI